MTSSLVDFHCHLDLYPNHEEIILECERAGVQTLSVTTTPKAWPHNHILISKTHFIRAALGLHPQLVAKRADEITIWESYQSQTRYIGEVGLDAGPYYFSSLELQKEIFQRILIKCNQVGGKILSIHSVRTATIVLDMIERYLKPDRGKVILHWFTGSKRDIHRAIEMGCYFSINYEMFSNEHRVSTIITIPLNRILTETDGPFCKIKNQPVKPMDVLNVVNFLAKEFHTSNESIKQQVCQNLENLESI